MSGLYQKALQYRKAKGLMNVSRGGVSFDEDSGIPLDEQKEILEQIEELVAENRITISKETMLLNPMKKGFIAPLLNALGTTLIVAGFFLFFQLTFQKDTQLNITASGETAAEGDVLSKVREDYEKDLDSLRAQAESEINEKDKEIRNIESRLENLDEQKRSLEENFQKNIDAKAQALEEEMQSALDAERQRLQAEGKAIVDIEAEIEAKRQEFEAERRREIETFRLAQEAELKKKEGELTDQISSIQTNLQRERNARLELERDFNSRIEEQKQAQLAAENKLLEAQQTVANLIEAQEEEQRLNDQIFGFYDLVQINLEEENMEAARVKLKELENFFYNSEVIKNPGITRNREMHLFLVNALEKYIDTEESIANIDTASLSAKAAVVNTINTKFQEAEAAYRQNDTVKAKKLYEEALATIPDINESYRKSLAISEAEREALYNQYRKEAADQLSNQSYAKAITNYREALKVMPASRDSGELESMLSDIMEAGYQLKGNPGAIRIEEAAARDILRQGDNLLKGASYLDAIDKYLQILSDYPRSSQLKSAKAGITNSMSKIQEFYTLESEASSASLTDLETSIAELRDELDSTKSELSTAEAGLKNSQKEVTALNKKLDQQQQDMEGFQTAIASQREELSQRNAELIRYKTVEEELKTRITELEGLNRQLEGRISGLETEKEGTVTVPEEVLRKVADYEILEKEMADLKKEYRTYATEEDTMVGSLGNVGYLSSRLKLSEILHSDLLTRVMPDLYERMRDFELALAEDAEQAGSDTALEKTLDIIDDYLALETAAEKTAYWSQQRELHKEDYLLLDFLESLQYALEKP